MSIRIIIKHFLILFVFIRNIVKVKHDWLRKIIILTTSYNHLLIVNSINFTMFTKMCPRCVCISGIDQYYKNDNELYEFCMNCREKNHRVDVYSSLSFCKF